MNKTAKNIADFELKIARFFQKIKFKKNKKINLTDEKKYGNLKYEINDLKAENEKKRI